MKKRFLFILFMAFLGMLPVLGNGTQERVAQADALFDQVLNSVYTPQEHDALMATLRQAISLYESALEANPNDPHVLKRLSRAYYTLADIFLQGKKDKRAAYAKGQEYGERALRLCPGFVELEKEKGFVEAVKSCEDIEALYWTYANWARKDEFEILAAFFRGDAPKLRALIERAAEVDETYICYGPLRSLGAYWAKLPFGKDLDKAKELFERAIAGCPEYLENLQFYVVYYADIVKDEELADRYVQKILDAPIGDYPLYNSWVKLWARSRVGG